MPRTNLVATLDLRQRIVITSHPPDLHTSSPPSQVGADGHTRPHFYSLTLIRIMCLRHTIISNEHNSRHSHEWALINSNLLRVSSRSQVRPRRGAHQMLTTTKLFKMGWTLCCGMNNQVWLCVSVFCKLANFLSSEQRGKACFPGCLLP